MALQQERERAGKHTPNVSQQQRLTLSSGRAGRGPGRPFGRGGEAGCTKSLSFTWARVQPQNSSPKTRSHERKKIARRRIIHTSLSYVGAERQPTVPLWSLCTAVPAGRCQLLPGIQHSPDACAHLRDAALLCSHP